MLNLNQRRPSYDLHGKSHCLVTNTINYSYSYSSYTPFYCNNQIISEEKSKYEIVEKNRQKCRDGCWSEDNFLVSDNKCWIFLQTFRLSPPPPLASSIKLSRCQVVTLSSLILGTTFVFMSDIRVHRAGSQLKIEELSSTHYHHPHPILHLLCYKYYFWVYCSIVLLFLCSCEFWQQCYYRLSQMENKTSLSLIVGLSCQFNRVSFINVYWIILNDRLSFWLFFYAVNLSLGIRAKFKQELSTTGQ